MFIWIIRLKKVKYLRFISSLDWNRFNLPYYLYSILVHLWSDSIRILTSHPKTKEFPSVVDAFLIVVFFSHLDIIG